MIQTIVGKNTIQYYYKSNKIVPYRMWHRINISMMKYAITQSLTQVVLDIVNIPQT